MLYMHRLDFCQLVSDVASKQSMPVHQASILFLFQALPMHQPMLHYLAMYSCHNAVIMQVLQHILFICPFAHLSSVSPLLGPVAKHSAMSSCPAGLPSNLLIHLFSKTVICTLQVTMHVCVFVFDLLYVDGDSLVHLPLRQRRSRLAAALPNLQPGHVQLATSLEFQPAAVSMAVAAAAGGAGSLAAYASHNGLPASADQEDFAAPARKGGSATASKAGSAAAGTQASQPAQRPGSRNSAVSSRDDVHCSDDAQDEDADMFDVSSSSGQRHKPDSKQHALGGGDIDATAAAPAAAAARDALPQAAAASGPTEGAAAAGAEAVVSDLAVQSIEDRIQEFLLESFAGGTEGLMLKALDVAAGYQPSKRSDSWIKLKRQVLPAHRQSSVCIGQVGSDLLSSWPFFHVTSVQVQSKPFASDRKSETRNLHGV